MEKLYKPLSKTQTILISTAPVIPGYEIVEYKGLVFGITIRSRGAGGRCLGSCEICVGGEITAYLESSFEARNDAIYRLVKEARMRGANAIISVRFDSSRAGSQGGLMDIVAYGTAVKVVKKP